MSASRGMFCAVYVFGRYVQMIQCDNSRLEADLIDETMKLKAGERRHR